MQSEVSRYLPSVQIQRDRDANAGITSVIPHGPLVTPEKLYHTLAKWSPVTNHILPCSLADFSGVKGAYGYRYWRIWKGRPLLCRGPNGSRIRRHIDRCGPIK
jgi:hypothetical protein